MPKRILQGVVVSDKNDKTVVVQVDRRTKHPLLKKIVRRSKKYHAHDEANAFKVGDVVRIVPNHSCVVSNLVDRVYVVDGMRVEDELDVEARGRIT